MSVIVRVNPQSVFITVTTRVIVHVSDSQVLAGRRYDQVQTCLTCRVHFGGVTAAEHDGGGESWCVHLQELPHNQHPHQRFNQHPTSLNPNNNSSSDTLLDYIPSSLSVDKESPTKVTHRESHKKYNGKESPTKICREKESPSKTCREKESPSKTCREKESPSKTCREKESPSKTCHGKESPIRKCRLKDISIKTCRGADSCIKTCQDRESPVRTCYDQDIHIRTWQGMDIPTKTPHSKDKSPKDAHNRDDCNRDFLRKSSKDSSGNHRSHKRHSRQEVETTSSRVGQTLHPSELVEATTASVKQELLHLSLARQALEADKLINFNTSQVHNCEQWDFSRLPMGAPGPAYSRRKQSRKKKKAQGIIPKRPVKSSQHSV
nr:uncharacterized protein LOC128689964 [Cherax quadricarinatus]